MAALRNITKETPYRGPEFFEKENWKYANKLEGQVEKFSCREKIYRDGECVYEAKYMVGLVDC